MYRNAYVFCFLVLTVAGLGGCSSGPSIKESKKAETPPDKIQGKAQENPSESTAADAAFNAGGHSVYLVDGLRRYRLFFKTAFQVDPGKEYIAEGVGKEYMEAMRKRPLTRLAIPTKGRTAIRSNQAASGSSRRLGPGWPLMWRICIPRPCAPG